MSRLHPLTVAVLTAFAASANAGTVTTDGQDLVLSTKGGLKIATADKNASVQLGGRLQWDFDATESDDNGVDTEDFDVRRARLYVKGNVGDWGYKIQFNVAEGDGSDGGDAEDLYIRYTGFGDLAEVTVGKQKEPFGLEELTSSKDISSLERSAMTEFYAPGRSGGVQLSGAAKHWTYGIGLFEADGDSSNDFDSTALTGRVTVAPIHTDDTLVHLGAGFSTRDADLSDDEVDMFNVELAGVLGPFHAQAEFFDAEFGDDDFDGWYVQAGWIITGETRPYKEGAFKRVKASGDAGAWELVLRYEDGDGKYSDIGLSSSQYMGEQTTLAVNWYVNNYVRLGVSYMDGEADNTAGQSFDGDEIRARLQFAF